jgi:hypothetical protein
VLMNTQECDITHDRLSAIFTMFMLMIGLEQHGRYGDWATDWKTEESTFDFRKRLDISSFLETSKPAPEPTQP